jgi:ABC-type cobalamin/Fe3+-siderophores transport system ATPase subunit
MSLVRLHEVTLRFDDNVVLHHVSFRLSAGERVGLIGRNGSGKTTLLRGVVAWLACLTWVAGLGDALPSVMEREEQRRWPPGPEAR